MTGRIARLALGIPPNNGPAGASKPCATAMTFRSTFLWILALGAGTGGAAHGASLPDNVDFNHHIKPLLSDRCFPWANQNDFPSPYSTTSVT